MPNEAKRATDTNLQGLPLKETQSRPGQLSDHFVNLITQSFDD